MLVVLAALCTALVVTPVAIHPRLPGLHVKQRLVAAVHRLVGAALLSLSLLVTGIVLLVFDVVTDRPFALAVAGVALAELVALLVLTPWRLVGRDE